MTAMMKGSAFLRMAIAKAVTRGNGIETAEYAASRWGEGSQPARLLKATVASGATVSDAWGEELVSEYAAVAADFLGLVRQQSIIGRLTGLRRVPLRVPVLAITSGATPAWVPEGAAMPLTSMQFQRRTLEALRIAAMTVATEELLTSADPAAEASIRADLVRAIMEASDTAFIDPANAGVADEMPSSVTNGLTPVEANPAGSFKADLERLVASFGGDLTTAVLVGKPELLVQLSGADYPNVGARGGEIAGIPAIASRSMPNDGDGNYQLALIDPTGIAYAADDVGAEIRASSQTTVQMLDNPTMDSTTPTATTTVSLWQVNAVAIAAMIRENWRVERAGSVALLSGIAPSEEPAS
ncbi:phage major capsid protein [Sphingomonas baiyangensis]|uniref:Phage major capsid protein n=1 Tax=Sphingomonas baiyangensis TaxID=2572576 RepID=A0A4U1L540_9SPHN|nr:phage major capsid protein [Sphingomonas baiyangensis]TKD52057.1 phage major capsid protein [Sphingomonas baiyangensis]